MTSAHSSLNQDQLTLLSVDSPAKTSAKRERVPAWLAADQASSTNCSESFAWWDPATSSWKTSAPSSVDQRVFPCPADDAYAAGILYGEGCITIHRRVKKGWEAFSLRVDLGMTDKAMDLLLWHRSRYGGSVNQNRAATSEWAAAHRWVITGAPAAAFLRRVLPYLRLKAEQARIGVKLEDALTQNGRKWNESLRAEGRVCWELIKHLNRKGPSESAPPGWFARLVGGQWLTSQTSLLTSHGLESFSERWPRQGMTRNGRAYRQRLWVPAINVIGGGALPTPTVNDSKNSTLPPSQQNRDSLPGHLLRDDCLPTGAATYMNPSFVEEMMGFPVGWTA